MQAISNGRDKDTTLVVKDFLRAAQKQQCQTKENVHGYLDYVAQVSSLKVSTIENMWSSLNDL
jgi:hypothetical protein